MKRQFQLVIILLLLLTGCTTLDPPAVSWTIKVSQEEEESILDTYPFYLRSRY
jgi:hypothetical protein